MRIAQLAPLWKTVPPKKYGGSELVVANLCDALVDRGHQVTLFACAGSNTKAELVEVLPDTMYDLAGGFKWDAILGYEFLSYSALGKHASNFDVIHNHMGFHPLAFESLLKVPVVTTLHSSVKPDFPYLAEAFAGSAYVSISNSQRSLVPHLNYVDTIYHGIDVNAFTAYLQQGKGDHFLFLGSLTANKGVDRAVRACKIAGKRLILAGEVRGDDAEWLEKEVWPYVDGKNIVWVGEVDHATKNKLLAAATALLLPIRWSEAFGLVMAEALACGTPVIAWNNGSVPEVISHQKTGYIVNSEKELITALLDVVTISREYCRSVAEERFSREAMAASYESIYQSLIDIK